MGGGGGERGTKGAKRGSAKSVGLSRLATLWRMCSLWRPLRHATVCDHDCLRVWGRGVLRKTQTFRWCGNSSEFFRANPEFRQWPEPCARRSAREGWETLRAGQRGKRGAARPRRPAATPAAPGKGRSPRGQWRRRATAGRHTPGPGHAHGRHCVVAAGRGFGDPVIR